MMYLESASCTRSATLCALNPPNITEWIAPYTRTGKVQSYCQFRNHPIDTYTITFKIPMAVSMAANLQTFFYIIRNRQIA